MSESFFLTLDTQAPVVNLGLVSNAVAGQMLTVAYTVDEVGTLVATLTLPDNRQFTMGDTGNAFRYTLPLDTPTGVATVEVEAEDDLGNVATYSTSFEVVGAQAIEIVPEAPSRRAGITPTGEEPGQVLVQRRSKNVVRHRRQVLALTGRRRSACEARTTRAASAAVLHRTVYHPTTVRTTTSSRVVRSLAEPETEVAISRVVDGPKVEEALTLLGVL